MNFDSLQQVKEYVVQARNLDELVDRLTRSQEYVCNKLIDAAFDPDRGDEFCAELIQAADGRLTQLLA